MNTISGISAFKDNYIWAIQPSQKPDVIIVDPGDAKPVINFINKNKLTLNAILITHHHWDHTDGVLPLMEYFKNIPVYGPINEKVEGVTHFLKEGDCITFSNFDLKLNVLDIPGHTRGHIAYLGQEALFCGDTLFSCGCGKLFEGTAEQMVNSLTKIKRLPLTTKVYCAHEYTLSNILFAQHVEPDNIMLKKWHQQVLALRKQNLPSLPSTLENELEVNPFLRFDHPDVIQAVQHHCQIQSNEATNIFAALRKWKDTFSPQMFVT